MVTTNNVNNPSKKIGASTSISKFSGSAKELKKGRRSLLKSSASYKPSKHNTKNRKTSSSDKPTQAKKLGFFPKKCIDKYEPNDEKFKFFTSLYKNMGDAPLKLYTKEVIDYIQ